MPEMQELRSDVAQLRTTVYGAEGQGGLLREVESVKVQVNEHEKRLNAISLKWLALMLIAGILGNTLGSSLLQAISTLQLP